MQPALHSALIPSYGSSFPKGIFHTRLLRLRLDGRGLLLLLLQLDVASLVTCPVKGEENLTELRGEAVTVLITVVVFVKSC